MKSFSLFLQERKQLPTVFVSKPRDRASIYDRVMWAWDFARYIAKKSGRLGPEELGMIGAVKRVMKTLFKRDVGEIDDESGYHRPKTRLATKDQQKFFDWYQHEIGHYISDKLRSYSNPEATFEKYWAGSIAKLYQREKQIAGRDYVWNIWLEKIRGRNSPRLTIAEQAKLISKYGKMLAPEWVIYELFGRDISSTDFEGRPKLNNMTDLFQVPVLPRGGILAQRIPETLILGFHARMKENYFGNYFAYKSFMEFIDRFCDKKVVNRFWRKGVVYRIEVAHGKWSPAAKDIDGIKSFLRNYFGAYTRKKWPMTLYKARTDYFDVTAYINFLYQNLRNSSYGDPEKEVIVAESAPFAPIRTFNSEADIESYLTSS